MSDFVLGVLFGGLFVTIGLMVWSILDRRHK